MEKAVHVARSFADAERWDIEQQIRLTPEQRQAIAGELRRRVYGPHPPDVRTSRDNARTFDTPELLLLLAKYQVEHPERP